jgi:quinol monooxygenase YgiN
MSQRREDETRLDALLEAIDFPVRAETLERAWNLLGTSAGEILVVVTFHARPGRMEELERAAREFVADSSHLVGGLFSALYRSAQDQLTLTLVERFADQSALDHHMRAPYFQRFQVAQAPLLIQPASAVVLNRVPVENGE